MSDSIAFQSWSDLYQRLRARAEAARGTVTITPSGTTPGTSYPHTTSRDAFAIALVFDTAINDRAPRGVLNRWLVESDLLAGEPDDSTDPYVGNRSLWETLAVAAIELDAARAPLPDPTLIDDAIAELDTPRPAAEQAIRNAARTLLVTVLTESSWSAMAIRQAEFFLRLHGLDSAARDREGRLRAPIPATRNSEVIALADYWTEQLARVGETATDTYHRLVYSSWRQALEQVQLYAKTSHPDATYILNNDFWERLIVLATQSDACGARPAPWSFGVAGPTARTRNAESDNLDALIKFPNVKVADDVARLQRDAFAQLRGEERHTGRLVSRVPRTTIGDVRRIAAYWTTELIDSGVSNFADVSAKHVLDRWWDALIAINAIPRAADPTAVYDRNLEFWEAVMTIAIQVAVTREAPSRLDLLSQSVKSAAESVWDKFLSRPLLYAGIGVGGLAALYLLLRLGRAASGPEIVP